MNKEQCAEIIARLSPDGKQMLENHIATYGEILLHILAGELITEPLIKLLRWNKQVELIPEYCSLIELMWRDGDDDVINVVDVTILEWKNSFSWESIYSKDNGKSWKYATRLEAKRVV